tara:strand:+ start:4400 stop:4804 length:405 start_codon:yes stop_codon:yes gene_type:complete
MSGAVGGVGGGGSAAGMSGVGASAGASGSVAASGNTGASAPVEAAGNSQSSKDVSDVGDKFSNGINIHIHNTNNMSTQNFVEMHNSCSQVSQVNESQGPDLDIKKLIELMIMMKLLEQLSQSNGGGNGGFSAMA